MTTISTYDPESVILTIGESVLIGWNNISISRTRPPFNKIEGIRGKHTRTLSYDTSATIRLVLPMSCEWNDIFSEILTQDTISGTGRNEIRLRDNSGSSLFFTREAYVVNYADINFDNTISERTWIIQCLSTDVFTVGGNTSPRSSLMDTITSGISTLFS